MEGKKFGEWLVLKYFPEKKPGKYYECMCKCGEIKIIPGVTLRAGRSKSCLDCSRFDKNNYTQYIGKKFGSWTVKSWKGNKINKNGHKADYLFECECECGNKSIKPTTDLTRKNASKICPECAGGGGNFESHGLTESGVYKSWGSMMTRCYNPNSINYNRYGGRGISVCSRWKKFINFYEDMGDRPDKLQIDRIDNNGNYEPSNCRWVTSKENNNNRYY